MKTKRHKIDTSLEMNYELFVSLITGCINIGTHNYLCTYHAINVFIYLLFIIGIFQVNWIQEK